MAKSEGAAPTRPWSLRSQRSIKRQFELEDEIAKFQKLIIYEEGRLAEAQVNRTRQAQLVVNGQLIYQRNLEDSILEIEQRKQKIKAYQEVTTCLQKEVEGLQPTRSQAGERAGKQAELARLAEERIEAVVSVDAAIYALRERLNIYAEVTRAMMKLAGEIDFNGEDFDSTRFGRLAVSLPMTMQAESRRWLEWFLGMEKDRHECKILHEFQSFPETLAAAHYYRRGEKPLLTENERKEAQAQEPRLLTPMEFEALHYGPKKPDDVPPEGIQWAMMRG